MTSYSTEDLAGDWEFKIVRANTPAFRHPRTLNRLIEREAQAGWTMIEKFDDQRVRFKRSKQARLNDANLPHGVNPYGSYYGMSPVAFGILTVFLALGFAGALIGIIVFFVH